MSTPRLPDYLQHIRLAAHQAETYIEGVELDEFLQNDFVQNAVRSTLITIGEAAKKRADDTRRKILVGAAILAKVESGEWPEKKMLAMMDSALTRKDDRALFGLEPLLPKD